jgi:hypothetical protein
VSSPEKKRKVWVLDTETKGTGANVVPLDRVERKPPAEPQPLSVPRKHQPKPRPEPEPEPRRFKLVDVMTREVLAEDADVRTALDVLESVRSFVDVNVYVWQPESERWRLIGLSEKQALWRLTGRQ